MQNLYCSVSFDASCFWYSVVYVLQFHSFILYMRVLPNKVPGAWTLYPDSCIHLNGVWLTAELCTYAHTQGEQYSITI